MFGKSEVLGRETGPFRDSGKHAGTDLLTIMKSECVIWPPGAGKNAMRAVDLAFDRPPDREEGSTYTLGLC